MYCAVLQAFTVPDNQHGVENVGNLYVVSLSQWNISKPGNPQRHERNPNLRTSC